MLVMGKELLNLQHNLGNNSLSFWAILSALVKTTGTVSNITGIQKSQTGVVLAYKNSINLSR